MALLLAAASWGGCIIDWDRLDPDNAVPSGATTSVGGGGGSGGGSSCSPGDEQPCYSGPDGTEGVGICASGVMTCGDDGAFGACVGDVLPSDESCETPVDDDCDGTTNEPDAGCDCIPGEQFACYDGPDGSEGEGICAGGLALCLPSGDGLGACTGQVLPFAEDCGSPLDEDCDGETQEHCPLGAVRFGAAGAEESLNDLAVLSDDSVIVVGLAGEGFGSFDLGGPTLNELGELDMFIGRLQEDGSHVWSQRLGDAASQVITAVAASASDDIYICGHSSGSIDFGNGVTFTPVGVTDAFIARLDADGVAQWATAIGSASATTLAFDVAVTASGIAATGSVDGMTGAFGAPLTTLGEDIWVARFNAATGVMTSGNVYGAMDVDRGVAIEAVGDDLIVAGEFDEPLSFGSGDIASQVLGQDGFIVRLDASDAQVWSFVIGGEGDQIVEALAVDGQDLLVAAESEGTYQILNRPAVPNMDDDLVVLKLDIGDGNLTWDRLFEGPEDQEPEAVVVTPNGDVWVGVKHEGSVDYGGGKILSQGDDDAVVLMLDASGNHLRSLRFGDPHDQDTYAIGLTSSGNVVAGIRCAGIVAFGPVTLPGNDSNDDLCLALLPP